VSTFADASKEIIITEILYPLMYVISRKKIIAKNLQAWFYHALSGAAKKILHIGRIFSFASTFTD
jgi:hypothetical protein